MSSSRCLSPLSVLTFSLLLQLAASDAPYGKCGGTYLPPNDPYNISITKVLRTLINDTPPTGFASVSVGQGVNQVYGLALYRGDLNATVCKACVERSSKIFETDCQYTQAIIYDDECEVRYSNTSFSGQVDQGDWYYFVGPGNVSSPVRFNENLVGLLNDMLEAVSGNSKFFIEGITSNDNSTIIYVVVQCTNDLSVANCKSCLTQASGWVPQYLYGKNGGKMVGGSCNLRFEIYKFFSDA